MGAQKALALLFLLLILTIPRVLATNVTTYVIPASDEDHDEDTPNTNCASHPVFKYLYVADPDGSGSSEVPPGFYEMNFDDSNWLTGPGPFGYSAQYPAACTEVLTAYPDDLFIRKQFTLYGEPKNGRLYVAVDSGVRCYVNGHLVLDQISKKKTAHYWNYSRSISASYLQEGNNILACWIANGGENSSTDGGYFDVALRVTVDSVDVGELDITAPAVALPGETIPVAIEPIPGLTEQEFATLDINVYLIDISGNVVYETNTTYTGGVHVATVQIPNRSGEYILEARTIFQPSDEDPMYVGTQVVVVTPEATAFSLPIQVTVDPMSAPLESNGQYAVVELTIDNMSDRNVSISAGNILAMGGFFRLPIDFATTAASCPEAPLEYTVYGDSVAYAISDTLPADATRTYHIHVESPYVSRLSDLCATTGDPTVCGYYQQAQEANTLGEQIQIYLLAKNYLDTKLYAPDISLVLAVTPSVTVGDTASGTLRVTIDGQPAYPDSITCTVKTPAGTEPCTLTPVAPGQYVVTDLPTDAPGTYFVEISATEAYMYSYAIATYTVLPESPLSRELIVMSDAIPPGGQALVLYTLDHETTPPPVITIFDRDASVIGEYNMEFNPTLGAYTFLIVTDANWADGDYVLRVTDPETGDRKYAIIRVDSTITDILAYVSDINAFLHEAIAPKLDQISTDVNRVYDYLNDNVYTKLLEIQSDLNDVIQTIDQLSTDINAQHAEELAYLQDINATAHQILQEVLYIKQKIDNVIIPKLDQLADNQHEMQTDLNDIKALLTCDQSPTGSVCFILQNMEIMLADLNTTVAEINSNVDYLVTNIDTVQSKLDTLLQYADDINRMLACDESPTNSVCARLESLRIRLEDTYQAVIDTNTFLAHVYDYIRNDLMSAVLDVGTKVEDINAYLRGDVWNKLVELHDELNATYREVNALIDLVQDHDATIQAQLYSMRSYLEEMNAQLSQKLDEIQATLDTHFAIIEGNLADLRGDTNTLMDYFNCTAPNGVCEYLYNIDNTVTDINATVANIDYKVDTLQTLMLTEFNYVSDRLDLIEENIAELKDLLMCTQYPDTSICARLDEMNATVQTTNNTVSAILDIVLDIRDLAEDINDQVHQPSPIEQIFSSGGGGGGGAATLQPIEVRYGPSTGIVLVGVPEGVPDGEYQIFYEGDLYRYVEDPPPKSTVTVKNGVIRFRIKPDVEGAVRGTVILRRGSTIYRIQVTFIASKTPLYEMPSTHRRIVTVEIPEGGAEVRFLGELAECMKNKTLYFAKAGEYKIQIPCDKPGAVMVVSRLNEYSVQYSLEQDTVTTADFNMFKTTVLPIVTFLVVLAVLQYVL